MTIFPYSSLKTKDVDEEVAKLVIYADNDEEARELAKLVKFLKKPEGFELLSDLINERDPFPDFPTGEDPAHRGY